MRTGKELCYAEAGDEVIPFSPENVAAAYVAKGPLNRIYLKDSDTAVEDRKDSRKQFLEKLLKVCPSLTERISAEYRSGGPEWLVDPEQIDWEETRDRNAMEDMAYNGSSDLILKSGTEIELRTPQIWEIARRHGTEEMIRNRNMISYGTGDPRPFSDVAMICLETTGYSYSDYITVIDRKGYIIHPGIDLMEETQALFRHPGCRFVISATGRDFILVNANLYDRASTEKFRTPDGRHYLAFDSGEGCPYMYGGRTISSHELGLLNRRIESGKPFLENEITAVRYLNAPEGIRQCYVYRGPQRFLYYYAPGQFDFLAPVTGELSVNLGMVDWDRTEMAWDHAYGERIDDDTVIVPRSSKLDERPVVFNAEMYAGGADERYPVIQISTAEKPGLARMRPEKGKDPDWFFLDARKARCPRLRISDVLAMVPLGEEGVRLRVYMRDGTEMLIGPNLEHRIREALGERLAESRVRMDGQSGKDHVPAWINLDHVETDHAEILTGTGSYASGDRLCPLRSRESGMITSLLMLKEEYEKLCALAEK